MIVDLHAHTHYSWCGEDSPKALVDEMVQQALVRETGLFVSIGFDGHRLKDYAVERVVAGNDFLQKAGIRNAVQLFLG